jgi:uncharacterized phage protein (TIGR02218 family)
VAFADYESSLEAGRPLFLYEFARQGKAWYYCNAELDIFYDNKTYLALPITQSDSTQSGKVNNNVMEITIPATAAMCQYLDLITPMSQIGVIVKKSHFDVVEQFDPSDVQSYWTGTLAGIKRSSAYKRTFVCNSLIETVSRNGLRLTWGRNCPHMLYGRGCNVNGSVDKEDYDLALASPTIVDGVTLEAAELAGEPDGWFNGGFVVWQTESGVYELRTIETHVGDTLTMFGSTTGMSGGLSFKAYPGCDRLPDTCNTKFGNMPNYGGVKHLQGRSPFDGNPVF